MNRIPVDAHVNSAGFQSVCFTIRWQATATINKIDRKEMQRPNLAESSACLSLFLSLSLPVFSSSH